MALSFLPRYLARPSMVSAGVLLVSRDGPVSVPVASIRAGTGVHASYLLLSRSLRRMIPCGDDRALCAEAQKTMNPYGLPPVLAVNTWARRDDGTWSSNLTIEQAEARWRWEPKGKLWVLASWARYWMKDSLSWNENRDRELAEQLFKIAEERS